MRNKEEARRLLAVPFALTRGIRAPESGLRRFRARDAYGRRAWTFDAVINFRSAGSDGDTMADNYSAAVVELPARFDGRIGLERRGFLRQPESLSAPEVEAGTEGLRRRFIKNPHAALQEMAERGLELTGCERWELAHMDRRELAELTGYSEAQIVSWERGRARLYPIELIKLCHALDVMPEWLLCWERRLH